MAQQSKEASSIPMRTPMSVSIGKIETHAKMLASVLAKLLNTNQSDLLLNVEKPQDAAVSLEGACTERVESRNRGRAQKVVKLCDFPVVGPAWIGFRESWTSVASRGGKPYYEFESAGLTLFVGEIGSISKAQIMRAEWAGYANRGGKLGFQGGDAGHPHWQIDIFETLRAKPETETRFDELAEPRAFTPPDLEVVGTRDILLNMPLERFHFASAAHWWLGRPENQLHHQNTPDDLNAISNWVLGTVDYVRTQLTNCC